MTIKKVLIISHNDLDGYGANILGYVANTSKHADIEVVNVANNEVDKVIQECIHKDISNYDYFIMSDISPSMSTAKMLNDIYLEGMNIMLLDHHKTALQLTQYYKWANVVVGKKECGTSLLYKYMLKHNLIPQRYKVEKIVHHIMEYDTWEWTKTNNQIAKDLNDLFFYYKGVNELDTFINGLVDSMQVVGDDIVFSQQDSAILNILKKLQDTYIQNKIKTCVITDCNRLVNDVYDRPVRVGMIVAEQHVSELGNVACKQLGLDMALILNFNSYTISLRSIGDNVDVSVMAKYFGGGGHTNAGGFTPTVNDIQYYIECIHEIRTINRATM